MKKLISFVAAIVLPSTCVFAQTDLSSHSHQQQHKAIELQLAPPATFEGNTQQTALVETSVKAFKVTPATVAAAETTVAADVSKPLNSVDSKTSITLPVRARQAFEEVSSSPFIAVFKEDFEQLSESDSRSSKNEVISLTSDLASQDQGVSFDDPSFDVVQTPAPIAAPAAAMSGSPVAGSGTFTEKEIGLANADVNASKTSASAKSLQPVAKSASNSKRGGRRNRRRSVKSAGAMWPLFSLMALFPILFFFLGCRELEESRKQFVLESTESSSAKTEVAAEESDLAGKSQPELKSDEIICDVDSKTATAAAATTVTVTPVACNGEVDGDNEASSISDRTKLVTAATDAELKAERKDDELASDTTRSTSATPESSVIANTNGEAALSGGQSTALGTEKRDAIRQNCHARKSANGPTILESNLAKQGSDDLTKIHGIEPATAKLLRQSDITSFRSLRGTSQIRLETILNKGGESFKLVNPSTWSEQARFALDGDWTGLSKWQTSNADCTESVEPLKESESPNASSQSDDLTKICGLGKASQKVLEENGICSFTKIASMTSWQLDKLFTSMPRRFQLIDTTSWPTQARELSGYTLQPEADSICTEMEILDEIDSIREVPNSGSTSSAIREKEPTKRL